MDCDRFEASLMDELEGQLDELSSAAAKRHLAGCARCSTLMGGLRATRRVAVLTILEPSVDLEDRILAAASRATRVAPAGRRMARVLSWAGSWAMRPQTAMAAVFVLMVGSSLLFVRRSKTAAMDSNVTVTAQGEPAPAQAAFDRESSPVDSKMAAAAHGAGQVGGAVAASPAPLVTAAPSAAAGAPGPAPTANGSFEGALAVKDGPMRALPKSASFGSDSRNAEAPAGAPALQRPMKKGSYDDGLASQNQAPAELDKQVVGGAAAAREQAAPSGNAGVDWNDALKSARAERDQKGCGVAAASLDAVGQQAWGTSAGYQATYDAAQCYKDLGQSDQALARYQRLLTVQRFSQLASQGIAAVKTGGGGQAAGKVATRRATSKPDYNPAPASPAPPPAAPPAQAAPTTPTQQGY